MRCYSSFSEMEELLTRNHFDFFIPKKTVMRRTRKGERLIEAPLVPPYIFVHSDYATLDAFKRPLSTLLYAKQLYSDGSHTTITVADKEMEDFIRVVTQRSPQVRIFPARELDLHAGQRIRLCGGPLDGVEGVLLKIKGIRDKQLVVSISGIMDVTAPVDRIFVQLLDEA